VGEQVIVEGLQKVKPGAVVKAVPAQIAKKAGE
jgi:membrane fusion protein (multidrug efflux system)